MTGPKPGFALPRHETKLPCVRVHPHPADYPSPVKILLLHLGDIVKKPLVAEGQKHGSGKQEDAQRDRYLC